MNEFALNKATCIMLHQCTEGDHLFPLPSVQLLCLTHCCFTFTCVPSSPSNHFLAPDTAHSAPVCFTRECGHAPEISPELCMDAYLLWKMQQLVCVCVCTRWKAGSRDGEKWEDLRKKFTVGIYRGREVGRGKGSAKCIKWYAFLSG